ncbi:MAG TPA: hypothetical protein VH720_06710 [Candidatus Limnocylindrales bacterium]
MNDDRTIAHGSTPRTVIAVIDEPSAGGRLQAGGHDPDHDHEAVRRRAAELGAGGATVILFPETDPGPLASSLPTEWSADGEEELFGNRLDPKRLDAAGRRGLAEQVDALRRTGADAWGWLPDEASAAALIDYAREQRADLILVSDADTKLRDQLAELDRAATIAVEAVAPRER